ncbi:MAG: glycosyltransferase [Cyanobacteria bacterium P01_A01_bin.123]
MKMSVLSPTTLDTYPATDRWGIEDAVMGFTQQTTNRFTQVAMPLVSVVIPVFNDGDALTFCLAALMAQTYPKDRYEIIVVDNGSQEDIQSILRDFGNVVLAHETCPSSHAARNRGIALAKGEIIAFVDADCIPALDWLANGVKRLTQTPNCGLVAGKVEFFFECAQQPTVAELYDSMTFLQQEKHIEEAGWGATANLMTFKHIIESVGHFDPTLTSIGDVEWGRRVTTQGYQAAYAESSCVYYPARPTLKAVYEKIRRIEGSRFQAQIGSRLSLYAFAIGIFKIWMRLRPPLRSATYKSFLEPRFEKPQHKIQVFLFITGVHYAVVVELCRILLGGEPRSA